MYSHVKLIYFCIIGCVICTVGARAETTADAHTATARTQDRVSYHTVMDKSRPSHRSGTHGTWDVEGALPLQRWELVAIFNLNYAQMKDVFGDGDFNSYSNARFALAWAPLPHFEIGLSSSITANYNSQANPQSSMVFGDPELRLKAPFRIGSLVSVAAIAAVRFPTGEGNQMLDVTAPRIDLRAAVTFEPKPRLCLHGNVGAVIDRSLNVLTTEYDAIKRFSGQLGDGTAVAFGVGGDYGFRITPNLALGPFLNLNGLFSPDAEDTSHQMMWASIGMVLNYHAFEFSLGADIRLLGTPADDNPLPGRLPFLIGLNLAYHFGLTPPVVYKTKTVEKVITKEKVVEKPVEVTKEVVKHIPTWNIAGQLVDARSKKSIPHGTVKIKGSEVSALRVDKTTGAFVTHQLKSNVPVALQVEASGYLKRQVPIAPQEKGTYTTTIELQPAGNATGILKGNVKSLSGKPLRARIFIPKLKKKVMSNKKNGAFELTVPNGTYQVVITAPRFRMQKKRIEVNPGEVVIINIDMKGRR